MMYSIRRKRILMSHQVNPQQLEETNVKRNERMATTLSICEIKN